MPADELYWNPMELDSDESIPYPKQYIDPWDLENYAYIRQHLDSVDLNSDPSSLGDTQDTSAFYYVHGKPLGVAPMNNNIYNVNRSYSPEKIYSKYDDYYYSPPPPPPKRYGSKFGGHYTIDHGTSNYAAIEELTVMHEAIEKRDYQKKQSRKPLKAHKSGKSDFFDYLSNVHAEESKKDKKHLKNIKVKSKTPRSRSYSFSVGDYEYEPYRINHATVSQPPYRGVEDLYVGPDYMDYSDLSPIYDDVRIPREKPSHFKLSNYGHLQIDYSSNWNNLNKYISN